MTKKTRAHYDEANKRLFSEPRMIEDLLKGFFDHSWVLGLDFKTLERVNSSFISSNTTTKKRESDIIWRIRWKDQWLYLFLLVEFQSTVDKFMCIRMLSYTMLLYEQIIKSDQKTLHEGKLPPVLPIVLYNGSKKWTASHSIDGLMRSGIPAGLKKYQPNFKYWLLDTGQAIIPNELANSNNFVSILVQLEQAKDRDEINRLICHLADIFRSAPGADSLIRAYDIYFKNALIMNDPGPEIKLADIVGDNQMLRERVAMWKQADFETGLSQGISQGLSQGISQGERAVIERLLKKKFGKLLPGHQVKLALMSEKQLLELTDKILFASSIDEVLNETEISI